MKPSEEIKKRAVEISKGEFNPDNLESPDTLIRLEAKIDSIGYIIMALCDYLDKEYERSTT